MDNCQMPSKNYRKETICRDSGSPIFWSENSFRFKNLFCNNI